MYYGFSVKRRGMGAIDPGVDFNPLTMQAREAVTVQFAQRQTQTDAVYQNGGGNGGGEGPNDSVTGILGDPIVQKGLAALAGVGLGAWIGSMFGGKR